MSRSFETLLFAVFMLLAGLSTSSSFSLNTHINIYGKTQCRQQQNRRRYAPLFMTDSSDAAPDEQQQQQQPPILCDLQTFLRLVGVADTGGMAKMVVQSGECRLNGAVETRRAKKLFAGDVVEVDVEMQDGGPSSWDVAKHVAANGYVYKPKVKKIKPKPAVLEDGTLEFGGRYRSEEWRKERKQKKAERKSQNSNKS